MSKQNKIILAIVSVVVIVGLLWTAVLISLVNKPQPSGIAAQATPSPTRTETGSTTPVTPAVSSTESPNPLEYKLAVIDEGGYVEESDLKVARFRYLLSELEKKTTNTRQQIADITVSTQQKGREHYGKDIKLIDIMEGANKAIPDGRRMDYAEVAAMVVVMLGQ